MTLMEHKKIVVQKKKDIITVVFSNPGCTTWVDSSYWNLSSRRVTCDKPLHTTNLYP